MRPANDRWRHFHSAIVAATIASAITATRGGSRNSQRQRTGMAAMATRFWFAASVEPTASTNPVTKTSTSRAAATASHGAARDSRRDRAVGASMRERPRRRCTSAPIG